MINNGNVGMEENNRKLMPHIAPSDYLEFIHKRRILSATIH